MLIPAAYPQRWPKAVIFDWDNTLVDTWRVCYEAFNDTLKKFEIPDCSPEDFYNQPHYSVRDSFPQQFGEKTEEAENFFLAHLQTIHLENLRPLPGAEKLLQLLLGKNIYTAVVSNKDGELLRREVQHLGWEHFFGQVIGSRDTPEDKPSPLPLIAALKDTHILPSHEVWFVGDSPLDTLCAKNANCVPVAVSQQAILEDTPTVYGKDCLGLSNLLMKL